MTITNDRSPTPTPAAAPPSYVRRHPILAAFGVLSGLSLFSALWPVSAVVVGVAVAGHATGLDRAAWRLAERLAARISPGATIRPAPSRHPRRPHRRGRSRPRRPPQRHGVRCMRPPRRRRGRATTRMRRIPQAIGPFAGAARHPRNAVSAQGSMGLGSDSSQGSVIPGGRAPPGAAAATSPCPETPWPRSPASRRGCRGWRHTAHEMRRGT
jgi:hypothetical protein